MHCSIPAIYHVIFGIFLEKYNYGPGKAGKTQGIFFFYFVATLNIVVCIKTAFQLVAQRSVRHFEV